MLFRSKVAKHTPKFQYFAFGQLTLTEKRQLTADIIALYETCLFDLGRMSPDWDFLVEEAWVDEIGA